MHLTWTTLETSEPVDVAPWLPAGAWRLRSVSRAKVIGSVAMISRTSPSPPRWAPFPPESRRTEYSPARSGNSVSIASIGVFSVFDIAT